MNFLESGKQQKQRRPSQDLTTRLNQRLFSASPPPPSTLKKSYIISSFPVAEERESNDSSPKYEHVMNLPILYIDCTFRLRS